MQSHEFEAALHVAHAEIAQQENEGGHGWDYQRQRQIFLRKLLNDPNQPQYVRGWIQQELNRLRRGSGVSRLLKGVPGKDVGHGLGKAGQHDHRHFRLEDPRSNRARPAVARRLKLARKYFELG